MFRRAYIFLLAALYVGMPLLVYALKYKVIAPIYFYAADAFYYLDIARYSVAHHGYTFDGQFLTNGFHPLWQYLLVGLGKLGLVDYSQNISPLLVTFYVDVAIATLASGIFCVAIARRLRRQPLALLSVAPGLFTIIASLNGSLDYSTWAAYVNGMECACAFLFFSLVLFLIHDGEMTSVRLAVVSACLGLAVLSRLDDIFIAAPILLLLLWWIPAQHRGRALLALSPCVLFILAYILYNWFTVGVFLPISGAAKFGFAVERNLKWTVRLFLPVATGDLPSALADASQNYNAFADVGTRLVPLLVPAAICLAELVVNRRRIANRQWILTDALAVGVLLKAGYNFAFVTLLDQGQWYYSVSIAIANFFLVLWLDRLLSRLFPSFHPTLRTKALLYGAHLLWVLLAFNILINKANFGGPAAHVRLIEDNQPLVAKLKSLGANRVVEFDDGFTSYAAQVPAIAGLGLALDAEAAGALKRGKFLDLAYRRGYRVAVAENIYRFQLDGIVRAEQAGGLPGMNMLLGTEFKRYRLIPLGNDGSADGISFYGLVPAPTR